MLLVKQITIIRCKNLVSEKWHFHFSPVSPHLLEKHSPGQNGQLWRYWFVPGTRTGGCVSLKHGYWATLPLCWHQSTISHQDDIVKTQGCYGFVTTRISWDAACLWGKICWDRNWCFIFKLESEHLPLLEMEKIFLWLNGTSLPLLWFSTSSFLEKGIINFKIIPAHRYVIYSPR